MPGSGSPYRDPRTYGFVAAEIALLGSIGVVALLCGPSLPIDRARAWLIILGLMTAISLVAGRGITGCWRGILIDGRYKMSLSRLQLLTWTLIILSAVVTVLVTNHAYGSEAPLSVEIPSELWVLMGIATTSGVAAPALLAGKVSEQPNSKELNKTILDLERTAGVQVDRELSSVVLTNLAPTDARWGDILKGDESGNAATVDLGKLQMLLFTFVLALGYGTALARALGGPGPIDALPAIEPSLNTLLGISHTGYLAAKTAPHSRRAGSEAGAGAGTGT